MSICYSLEIESQLSVREVETNPPLRITWCLSKGHNNWNVSGAWEETQWAIKTIQSNRVWCLSLLTGISLSESLHNPNENNITTFDHVTRVIIWNIWRIKPAQKFQCHCEKKIDPVNNAQSFAVRPWGAAKCFTLVLRLLRNLYDR